VEERSARSNDLSSPFHFIYRHTHRHQNLDLATAGRMGKATQARGKRQQETALRKSLREESEILTAQAEVRQQQSLQVNGSGRDPGADQVSVRGRKPKGRTLLRWSPGSPCEALSFASTGLSEAYQKLRLDPQLDDEALLGRLLGIYHKTVSFFSLSAISS
jgi:hypothetical protein